MRTDNCCSRLKAHLLPKILTPAVHIPHHLTHQFQRFAYKMTETRPADHRFLRNARPETVQRQLRKKGIPAIGGLFIGRIGLIQINVSLPQGRLEQHGERICRFITPQGTFQRSAGRRQQVRYARPFHRASP